MNQTEIIKNHEIYSSVKEAIRLSSEIRNSEKITFDFLESIDETHYVLFTFEILLLKLDPLLINLKVLDSVNNTIRNLNANFLEIQKNPTSSGHLANVKTYTINLIDNLHFFRSLNTIDELDGIREATVSFRMSIAQHLRHVTNDIQEREVQLKNLASQVEDLKRQLQSLSTRSDNSINDFQRQFSESEAMRQREHNAAALERAQHFQNDLDKYDQKIAELNSRFEYDLNDMEERFDKYLEKFEVGQQGKLDRAEEILSKLNEYQAAAKKVLGTITVDGHAAGYQKVADSARKTKYIWQIGTVVLFLLLIVSAVWNAFGDSVGFNWTKLAAKWSVTLAIGAAVAYTAKQAARQDQVERNNRNMELQMATIDPYLDIFNEDERREIKRQLVDRIFTGYPSKDEQTNQQVVVSHSELGKIIEGIIAAVLKK